MKKQQSMKNKEKGGNSRWKQKNNLYLLFFLFYNHYKDDLFDVNLFKPEC